MEDLYDQIFAIFSEPTEEDLSNKFKWKKYGMILYIFIMYICDFIFSMYSIIILLMIIENYHRVGIDHCDFYAMLKMFLLTISGVVGTSSILWLSAKELLSYNVCTTMNKNGKCECDKNGKNNKIE